MLHHESCTLSGEDFTSLPAKLLLFIVSHPRSLTLDSVFQEETLDCWGTLPLIWNKYLPASLSLGFTLSIPLPLQSILLLNLFNPHLEPNEWGLASLVMWCPQLICLPTWDWFLFTWPVLAHFLTFPAINLNVLATLPSAYWSKTNCKSSVRHWT